MTKTRLLGGRRLLALIAALTLVLSLAFSTALVFADEPTDEILNYTITADVNEDATVNLTYHIEWKVLDSDSLGPLSWVNVGVANSHVGDYAALSDNIKSIEFTDGYGGCNMEIYFDRDYYEDEIVSFDFMIVQDYIYTMNYMQDGYTTYSFTPGWFDGIAVDNLEIRWNSDQIQSFDPQCIMSGGYHVWKTSLDAGEYYTIRVDYLNDAYAFAADKFIQQGSEYDSYYYDDSYDFLEYGALGYFGIVAFATAVSVAVGIIKAAGGNAYSSGSGFKSETKTEVKRTKVKYYANCPGCGAVRGEGQVECEYCGHSFIESEEVVEEKEIPVEDRENADLDTDGEYKSSTPNTYYRVTHIPVIVHTPSHHSSGHSGGGHHSSCACACASCACACACACAGGGRAGCTTKDFYNTGLKLKMLEDKKKK